MSSTFQNNLETQRFKQDCNGKTEIKQEQWDQSRFQKQLQKSVNQISLNDKNFIVMQTQHVKSGIYQQKCLNVNSSKEQFEVQPKFKQINVNVNEQQKYESIKKQSFKICQNEDSNQKSIKEENTDKNSQSKTQDKKIDLILFKPQSIELQKITKFNQQCKSSTIQLTDLNIVAEQTALYYQNHKLVLTEPIKSLKSSIKFRLDNIKYCVGFGVALKEVIVQNQYDYKSKTNQLGHGLYIVTTQGFSWSHSQKQQDDIFREGFNLLYSGVSVQVQLNGQNLSFKWKKGSFSIQVPTRIRQKYTLCFCAYLHEKGDEISIDQ